MYDIDHLSRRHAARGGGGGEVAQFLQYKAGDQRDASSRLTGLTVLCFFFIRFLVLFKYRKTENRPHMTEKNVNWNVKRIHRQIKYKLHKLSVHRFCM